MNRQDGYLEGQQPAPEAVAICEADRLQTLALYGLADLEDDPELQRITQFAKTLCDTPMALVSLVEEDRQWFAARTGIEARETPRSVSFCAHAMLRDDIYQIYDASTDPRFADNALVTGEPHIRFYAGAPLVSDEGVPLGSLCVIDTKPRHDGLTEFQHDGLKVLATAVMRRLTSRRQDVAAADDRLRMRQQMNEVSDLIPDLAWSANANGEVEYRNRRFLDYIGDTDFESIAYIADEDRERVLAAWDEAVRTGSDYETEYRFRRHDGEYRWMLARALPLRRADGSVERWFGTLTDIDEAHRISHAREVLARELSHRIKNIFAVISGLTAMTFRRHPDLGEVGDELIEKIRALGRAHDFVRPEEDMGESNLHGLLRQLFEPYSANGESRVRVSGDDLPVMARAATPLALVFHELATNSAKYGCLSTDDDTVDVSIAHAGDTVAIEWREDDVPQPDEAPVGFGSQLLTMSIEGQLRGKIVREWVNDGLTVRLMVPRSAISG